MAAERLALKIRFGEKTKEYYCRKEITVAEFLRNACVEIEVVPQYSPANYIINFEFEIVAPKSTIDKEVTGFAIKPKHYDMSLCEIGIQSGRHLVICDAAPSKLKETKTSTPSSKLEVKTPGKKTKEDAVEAYMPVLEEILTQPGSTTIEASEILPYLYIGGKPAAEECLDRGNALRFTHILNCAEPWCPMGFGKGAETIKYAGIEARDHATYKILEHYDKDCKKALVEAKAQYEDSKQGKILVNCAMGMNRSAAIVVAFLIDQVKMELVDAVKLVKEKRGCVLTNKGFQKELIEFAWARRTR